MARTKTKAATAAPAETAKPEREVEPSMLEELGALIERQALRIDQLEGKIDAIEKRLAMQAPRTADEIFRKGSDPFESRMRK